MHRLDDRVIFANRQRLGVLQRLLKSRREFVHAHASAPENGSISARWGRGA
jgi:hypothetical protein